MVQERVSGNGNFDIDAITRLVSADANAPTLIEQPFIDRELAELEAEAAELEADLQNPSSNRIDEAQAFMQRTGAAKLNVSGLQAGITIQESRNEFSGGARGSDRVWEERKEDAKKEREAQARAADMADVANNTSQREAEIARREEEFANVDVTMGDITMTGRNWRAAAMLMRDENFRREMEAWARARGYTDAEIEEAATVSDEIMLKNARGESLTPAEQRAYEENELVRENIRRAAERVQPGVTNTADANASLVSSDARSNDPLASTNARMGILAGNDSTVNSIGANPAITARLSVSAQLNNQENFAGAPSLSRSFDAANAAITPLDVRQPQMAVAAPVAPANAGLDI